MKQIYGCTDTYGGSRTRVVDESVEGDGSGSTKCINSFSDTKRGNTGSVSDWASVSNIEELND
jgi:hypothetical protein